MPIRPNGTSWPNWGRGVTGERYRDTFRFMAKKNANLTDGPGTLHPDYVAGMEARDPLP